MNKQEREDTMSDIILHHYAFSTFSEKGERP